jgi:predicted dehydrogenase
MTGVAVVGADPSGRGFGARAHVQAVLALDELRLAAVCTAREETARAAAERWPGAAGYSDYREAVASDEVEIVTIAVRVSLHAAIAEAALEAGKAVYSEWPLTLDAESAGRLAERAREHGVATAVGTQGRFAPAVVAAKRMLDSGEIGRPLSFQLAHQLPRFGVESTRPWLAQEEQGSGALHVATAHATDTLQFLLGPIASIAGARATRLPDDVYADTGAPFVWTASDNVAYTARLADGTIGSALVSNTADPAVGFWLRILADEGQLVLRAPGYASFAPARLFRAPRGGPEPVEVAVDPPEGIALDPSEAGYNVALALRAFAREGRSFRPSFDDAVVLHRVLEGIARSSAQAVWVEL